MSVATIEKVDYVSVGADMGRHHNYVKPKNVLRGDIYFADLGQRKSSVQSGKRPVLIIQNDIGNRFSPTVIVAPISAQIQKAKLPTHVLLAAVKYGLERDSVVLFEQIQTIPKSDLGDKITHISERDMKDILQGAMQISIGIIH